MIVKILASSASFNGVNYNTDKIESGKGDLMKVSNFGPLQALGNLRPEDYRNYLKLLSAQNKRVTAPQFHALFLLREKLMIKRRYRDSRFMADRNGLWNTALPHSLPQGHR